SIPEIQDFQKDLTDIANQLKEINLQKDILTEKILETVSKDSITNFDDLNFRWDRLTADKVYELKGLDYTAVVFTKDVVNAFEHNLLTGSRFLAALSKSYVSIKNASGLRKLSGIHEGFRDIKVI